MTARASAVAAADERRLLVADEPAGRDQPLGEPAGHERRPVVDRRRADLAIQHAVAAVDEAARIAVRTGIAFDGRRGRPLGRVSRRRLDHRSVTSSSLRPADRVDDPRDLRPEEDRDRDRRRDDRLDDEAPRARVDVREQVGHGSSGPARRSPTASYARPILPPDPRPERTRQVPNRVRRCSR